MGNYMEIRSIPTKTRHTCKKCGAKYVLYTWEVFIAKNTCVLNFCIDDPKQPKPPHGIAVNHC